MKKDKIDMLGFKPNEVLSNGKGVIYEKQDDDYTYVIAINVAIEIINFYKIKRLTSNNYKELILELKNKPEAEIWGASKEVIELSLKLYDKVNDIYNNYIKKRA